MLYVPIEMSRKQMYARTQFICAKIVTFCGNDKYFNVSLGYAYYIIKKARHSMTSSTGQWSLPYISVCIDADAMLACIRSDTMK